MGNVLGRSYEHGEVTHAEGMVKAQAFAARKSNRGAKTPSFQGLLRENGHHHSMLIV